LVTEAHRCEQLA